jgi:hypothetical protein
MKKKNKTKQTNKQTNKQKLVILIVLEQLEGFPPFNVLNA